MNQIEWAVNGQTYCVSGNEHRHTLPDRIDPERPPPQKLLSSCCRIVAVYYGSSKTLFIGKELLFWKGKKGY